VKDLRLLIIQAQGGDMDAFGEIVRGFQNMALGYAYSILGRFDLAEDAVQDAFIAAWNALPDLQHPQAFPAWFKRVIFKHCDRQTRRRNLPMVGLDQIAEVPSDEPNPLELASQSDLQTKVLEAVRALPPDECTVTTLFYIDGYSQSDISEFLELPVTTVNNRLHTSRNRLKERMLKMFSDELKNHTLSEDFPERIKMLLNQPKPLEIEGHPIHELWEAMCACFTDFEVIHFDEVIPRNVSPLSSKTISKHIHSVDEQRILRSDTDAQLVDLWVRRERKPCKWLTAGRVFRVVKTETETALGIFHQAELYWVGEGLGVQQLTDTVNNCLPYLVPGSKPYIRDSTASFPFMQISKEFDLSWQDSMLEVGAGGVGDAELLQRGGLDPNRYGSIHIAFGLERCALVKYNLDDARKLWQPPYVR